MSKRQLQRDYRRVHPGVYMRKGAELDLRARIIAAACRGGDEAVLVGFSALALHGVEWFDNEPAELSGPNITRAPRGIIARQYELLPTEIEVIDGVRVTSAARTGYDLGRRLPFPRAVAVLDSLCHVTGQDPAEILDLRAAHEYDGTQHWTDRRQHARDIDRHANLTAQGWTVIRVSATHLRTHPHLILTRVAAALRAANAPTPTTMHSGTQMSELPYLSACSSMVRGVMRAEGRSRRQLGG